MRLPRVRLRTLMIAVAVEGALLACGIEARRLWRISRTHRQRAAEYADLEAMHRNSAWITARTVGTFKVAAELLRRDHMPECFPSLLRGLSENGYFTEPPRSFRQLADDSDQSAREYRQSEERETRRAEYYAGLKRTHERAARYPWLPVPPDPPIPK